MRAQFEVLKHKYGEFIFIRDIGRNCRSVTNDVRNVIEQLYLEYDISDKTRIFYKDSIGNIDEICHFGKKFGRFKAGHQGIDLE